MNPKLEAIMDRAAEDLKALIADGEEKILEAWNSAEEEAQANDTKPVFKIGFAINLDLDKNQMESAITFGVRHKLSVDSAIPDPAQPDLGFKDETISFSLPGKESVTLSVDTFSKIAGNPRKL